jgi:outer membrane protein
MKHHALLLKALFLALLILPVPAGAAAAPAYSLAELAQIALARSERLKIAEESLGIAETGKDKARSYLFPRMTATGSALRYSEEKRSATGSVIQPNDASSWGMRVEETFSLSGREWTALEIADQTAAKSRLDVTSLREDYLLRNVAAAYFNVLMAQKNLDIAEANLERLAAHRQAAEVRLKVGEVTKTALLRAEGELSGAKSEHLQAKNGLDLALAVLASNCGIAGPLSVTETQPAPAEIAAIEAFEQEAYARRADLKGLELQRQIAVGQTKVAAGAFWPNLSLSGVYAGADQNPASTNLNRESLYAGVSLNFPFFEGGLRQAELAEARARERQAALSVEELKKAIAIEVRTAYLDMKTQQGILQFLADQRTFARDHYQAVSRQFAYGLSSSLDVMDANAQLVSAERKWASALYNVQLSLLKMKKATGTLIDSITKETVGPSGS